MHALGHPLFKQLRYKVVQSKRFSSFARELSYCLITLSGPYPIIRYKISINALTSSVSVTSEVFYDIVRDYKKSPANNYKHYRKMIQWVSKRSDSEQVSFKNAVAASNTSGLWRVYLSVKLPQRRGHVSFDINISQGSVVTRLRCGGIFNDSFIANFMQIVIVKEFQKSVSIWWSYAWNTPDSFFPDTV